ncbi:MAG: protein-disulfide reductase DsbD domain-containing protein [Pseudomonadota bacterium]
MQKYLIYGLATAGVLAVFSSNESLAGEIGPTASIEQSSALLLIAPPDDDQMVRGAIKLTLSDGFKTYWHVPGDGGLPPLIEIDGQPIEVRLPAPTRYIDQYGEALGYKDEVAITFEVPKPQSDLVELDMLVGVCADICIPFIAKLKAPVPADMMPRTRFALDDAFDALPLSFDADLGVNSVRAFSGASGDNGGEIGLTAGLSLPADIDLDEVDLFVRLPGPDEFFPRAATIVRVPGGAEAVVKITTDLTLDELTNKRATFTLVSGDRSVEGDLLLH